MKLLNWIKNILNKDDENWSEWIDIGMTENRGYYKLVQMKVNLKDNSKKFNITSMGFINDYKAQNNLYANSLKHTKQSLTEETK